MAKKEKKAKKGKEKEEGEEKDEKDAPEAKEEKPAGEGAGGEGEGGEGGEGEGGEAKPKSKKKLIIIIVVALLMLGAVGGGAAFFFLGHKGGSAEEGGSGEGGSGSAKVEQPTYFDLPELLVNLNTSGKQTSFIKATVTLELGNKEDVPVLQANLPRLMDSYNTFLREMHASDLYGSAGIYRLREEMLSRANTILAPVVVKDVLFREILIQ